MATVVRTKDVAIAIDPSAALAPRRFGLPPHRIEVEKLFEAFYSIEDRLRDVDLVIVTHYHYDHHDPGKFMDLNVLRGKVLIVKDPKEKINVSQRIRAHRFLKLVQDLVKEVRVGDGIEISVGKTRIRIFDPVPHGENHRLGYVLEVCIDDGEDRFLYTSDIEGGPLEEQVEPFYLCKPRIAVVDGPPTYLLSYKYSFESFQKSLQNLSRVLENTWIEILVIDHHSARGLDYRAKLEPLITKSAMLGKKVLLASEFMGLEPKLLEARRKELFELDPRDGLEILRSRGLKALPEAEE